MLCVFHFLFGPIQAVENGLSCCVTLQKDVLCQQVGISPSVSQDAFEDAVFTRVGKDHFALDTLRW